MAANRLGGGCCSNASLKRLSSLRGKDCLVCGAAGAHYSRSIQLRASRDSSAAATHPGAPREHRLSQLPQALR